MALAALRQLPEAAISPLLQPIRGGWSPLWDLTMQEIILIPSGPEALPQPSALIWVEGLEAAAGGGAGVCCFC